MKSNRLVLTLVLALMLVFSSFVFASDYQPYPGVLSPDEVDFGGRTVTIIRGALPEDAERVAQAEELFNVKLEQIRIENPDLIMARIMANDSTYDIIRAPHREGFFVLAAAGMLLPVDDYLPEEFFESLPNVDRMIIEKLKYQGQRYGIGVSAGVFNESMMITSYNKDLIEKYELPDPYELYLAGEWTYEAMEKIATALTMDTDGDGVIDQRGITAVDTYQAMIRFAGSNGAELAKQDENGKWVFAFNSPEAIEAFNTVLRWTESGIMGSGDYTAGNVGFFIHTHLGGNRHAQAAGVNFGFVPMPMGPHVDRYHYPVFDFPIMFLPVNAEYPEGLIALANFLYREEDTLEKFDTHINQWTLTREHFDVYSTAAESWQGEGDVFQSTELWDIMPPPILQVLRGEKSAAAAMDEIAPTAQAYLDDLFGQ